MYFEQAELPRGMYKRKSVEKTFLTSLYEHNISLQDLRDAIYALKLSKASEYLRLEELETCLNQELVRYEDKRVTFIKFLDSISCNITREVLKRRYVEFQTFDFISNEMNYDIRTIFRYQQKGLNWVKSELKRKEELCP